MLTAQLAFADGLITELKEFRSSPLFSKRVGLESEITDLNQDTVAQILRRHLKGHVTQVVNEYNYNDSKGAPHVYRTRDLVLESSIIDDVLIKPEDNAPTLDELSRTTPSPRILEIVTEPLHLPQVKRYQMVLNRLKLAGARGTTENEAIAFQVNVEMAKRPQDVNVELVLKVLRNYLRPQNRAEIEAELGVPEIRQGFVGYPQPGFMSRLFSADYHPTPWQLYMDSMYRSSLEYLEGPQAWAYTDWEARERLKAHIEKNGFEGVLKVLKWNYVRYSSLMMFMFPDDWLSKYLLSTDWFKPHPILEFREPNSDFKAIHHVEWILGLIAASEEVGDFNSDLLFARRCAHMVTNAQ